MFNFLGRLLNMEGIIGENIYTEWTKSNVSCIFAGTYNTLSCPAFHQNTFAKVSCLLYTVLL